MRRSTSGISCLLAIDKPLGLSSHDVVNRVRRTLGERRVGHAGTLDPAASGVLVVGVGQATRLLGLLTLDDKRYEAHIAFGTQTSTDDAEGEVILTAEVPDRLADAGVAAAVVSSLVGPCDQVPPAFSAISVDGKRAYDRARSGEVVDLPVRHVTIHEAELLGVESVDPIVWRCSLHVSKGTYVRSIARDLGQSLGTAAHLCGLRRTSSGPIGLERCLALDALEGMTADEAIEHSLDPSVALALPLRMLSPSELEDVRCGRQIPLGLVRDRSGVQVSPRQGERVCLVHDGKLHGVWELRGRRLASVATFPDGVMGVSL